MIPSSLLFRPRPPGKAHGPTAGPLLPCCLSAATQNFLAPQHPRLALSSSQLSALAAGSSALFSLPCTPHLLLSLLQLPESLKLLTGLKLSPPSQLTAGVDSGFLPAGLSPGPLHALPGPVSSPPVGRAPTRHPCFSSSCVHVRVGCMDPAQVCTSSLTFQGSRLSGQLYVQQSPDCQGLLSSSSANRS